MSAMMPTGHDGQWTSVCMLCFSIPQSANFSTIIISMILARSWPQSVGNARDPSRGHVLITSVCLNIDVKMWHWHHGVQHAHHILFGVYACQCVSLSGASVSNAHTGCLPSSIYQLLLLKSVQT